MIATLVDHTMANWNGDTKMYHLDAPFDGWYHLAVERFAEDTVVHPCFPNGGAVPHPSGGLAPWRTYPAPCTHEEALAELGYEATS